MHGLQKNQNTYYWYCESKSGTNEYYITERLKMWGVMYIAGFTDKYYQPSEWKEFSEKYDVGFYDVIERTIPKDKTLKNELRENKNNSAVYKGVEHFFENILIEFPNLERIGFNGKTISSWILEYYHTSNISASSKYLLNNHTKDLKNPADLYFHNFELSIKNKKIIATVLPNTSGRSTNFDEKPWIKFWQSINNK